MSVTVITVSIAVSFVNVTVFIVSVSVITANIAVSFVSVTVK